MKKVPVTVTYDDERLSALKLFLEKKEFTVEQQLELCLENLYLKNVPVDVRKYLEMKLAETNDSLTHKITKHAKAESIPEKQTPVKPPVSREESASGQ